MPSGTRIARYGIAGVSIGAATAEIALGYALAAPTFGASIVIGHLAASFTLAGGATVYGGLKYSESKEEQAEDEQKTWEREHAMTPQVPHLNQAPGVGGMIPPGAYGPKGPGRGLKSLAPSKLSSVLQGPSDESMPFATKEVEMESVKEPSPSLLFLNPYDQYISTPPATRGDASSFGGGMFGNLDY